MILTQLTKTRYENKTIFDVTVVVDHDGRSYGRRA
jgi:hypothetical protein